MPPVYQGERAAVRNTFASACREEEGGRKGSEREREHLLLEELALLCSRFHALTDTSTRTPGKDVQSYVHVHTHMRMHVGKYAQARNVYALSMSQPATSIEGETERGSGGER